MNDATWTYLAQLVMAMRQYGVRGSRIGEHVAEIAQHLEDSNGDPVTELGPPAELAARLAEDERRIPVWMRSFLVRLGSMTVAMIGAAIIVPAVTRASGQVSVTVGMILSAVGFGLLIVTLSRLLIGRLDGRTALSAVSWPVVVCWLVGSALITTAGGADHVIIEWSRPVAVAVAVVLFCVGIGIAARVDSPVRFPPHARHLNRLRRGFLAGNHAPKVPSAH